MTDESPMTFQTWDEATDDQLFQTFIYYWWRAFRDAQALNFEIKKVVNGKPVYCGFGMLEFTFVYVATKELLARGYSVEAIVKVLRGRYILDIRPSAYAAFYEGFQVFPSDDEDGSLAHTFDVLKGVSEVSGVRWR